jgi:hypothetical protein
MWEKLEDIMSDEINVSCPKTNTVWFLSHEVSRVVKFIETKRRMVVARGKGRGRGRERNRELLSTVSVLQKWKNGSRDWCTIIWIYLTLWNCAIKNS